ncbi:hypothetical protein G6Y81_07520 [Staphylococcus aureus]|nr:hypothetical protein [Staphylococcus aureus]
MVERQIGTKRRVTRALAEGGTELADTATEDARCAVLDDAQPIALATVAGPYTHPQKKNTTTQSPPYICPANTNKQ